MHACACTLALSLRALLLAGVGLLIIGVAVVGYLLNKYNFDIRVVAIGVDYFQVLAIFANARVKWPAAIKELFRILSALYVRLCARLFTHSNRQRRHSQHTVRVVLLLPALQQPEH